MKPCAHKWVFLRKEENKEIRWHVWATVDRFFCENCLEQKTIETEVEKNTRVG